MSARELARWLSIVSANRLVNPCPVTWKNTGRGGYIHGGEAFSTSAEVLAEAVDAVSEVNWPREVARWVVLQHVQQAGACIKHDGVRWLAEKGSGTWGEVSCRWRMDGTKHPADKTELSSPARSMLTFPPAPTGAIPLMVELCAGLGAVSLTLQGGPNARPPVSRMGNKRGYASAVLWACGLRQGQGAQRFIFCEPDPGASALLRAYGQPEVLREAAAIIRGWADCDPRELWERLKAEGPIKEASAGEVARWATVQRWHYGNIGLTADLSNAGTGGVSTFGANNFGDTVTTARAMDTAPTFPAITVHPDAREVDPLAVAASMGLDRLPAGTVAYCDPSYVGTTGYGDNLTRAEVVTMALRWADAGALVCVSEAVAVDELVDEGWHALDITSTRKGQRRTFARVSTEWLTMSEPPHWTPAEQLGLFPGDPE